jgi:hypothetical protein
MSQTDTLSNELVFGEVFLTFFYLFPASLDPLSNSEKDLLQRSQLSNGQRQQILRKYKDAMEIILKEKLCYNNKIEPKIEGITYAEKFILRSIQGQKLIEDCYRVKIDRFSFFYAVNNTDTSVDASKKNEIVVDVYFTIYPRTDVGIIFFNIVRKDATTDDIIFIKQCFDGHHHVSFQNVKGKDKSKLFTKLNEYAVNLIKKTDYEYFLFTHLVEIRDPIKNSGSLINNPQHLIQHFPQQLYGIITGDEGWRFVPHDILNSRISNTWSTRDFFTVISFDKCVLSINFSNGERRRKYEDQQEEILTQYGQEQLHYFYKEKLPQIAGVDHGPFLLLEQISIIRCLLDEIEEKHKFESTTSIEEIYALKSKLYCMFSDMLCSSGIKEIDILAQNIRDSLLIDAKLNELTKHQDTAEKKLIIDNNKKINKILIYLAVIGGLGAIATIIDVLKGILK